MDDYMCDYAEYWDDLSGASLDPNLVHQAKVEELHEFKKHNVYGKVPLKECWDNTGKGPIGIRWVLVNKGDEAKPEYRARLAAKELRRGRRDDLFAATPPLEALKILFSLAVTEGIGFEHKSIRNKGMKIGFIDIRNKGIFSCACTQGSLYRASRRGQTRGVLWQVT